MPSVTDGLLSGLLVRAWRPGGGGGHYFLLVGREPLGCRGLPPPLRCWPPLPPLRCCPPWGRPDFPEEVPFAAPAAPEASPGAPSRGSAAEALSPVCLSPACLSPDSLDRDGLASGLPSSALSGAFSAGRAVAAVPPCCRRALVCRFGCCRRTGAPLAGAAAAAAA